MRYRPHYPQEILPYLKKQIGLDERWIIADIGSGTGISSEIFLVNGNTVYGVEPNQDMREAAEKNLGTKRFISVNGTAEATTLGNSSLDLIVACQAFHWFDQKESKREFQRIAKPEAFLLLMWNERKLESAFQLAYEKMLLELAPGYEKICQRNIDETAITNFFSPFPYQLQTFPNVQYFDLEGLKGRLLSTSYAPLENQPSYKLIMSRLTEIFEQFKMDGLVAYEYSCQLYYGKIASSLRVTTPF